MSRNRGCLANSCLFLVIVFLPLIGQALVTLMVLDDEHTFLWTVIWLVVVWVLPFLGPLLYLFFGQRPARHGRVMFGQPSYPYQPA